MRRVRDVGEAWSRSAPSSRATIALVRSFSTNARPALRAAFGRPRPQRPAGRETGKRGVQPNASSCPTDDHHFVAFGVGDPPAILRLVKEPATGCDGRGEARLRVVRRHRELDVDAVALPAPLRL